MDAIRDKLWDDLDQLYIHGTHNFVDAENLWVPNAQIDGLTNDRDVTYMIKKRVSQIIKKDRTSTITKMRTPSLQSLSDLTLRQRHPHVLSETNIV